jgi:hypothetical protein
MTELASAEPSTDRDAPFRARLPYTRGGDGGLRPYVVLEAIGPNEKAVRFRGLIDTGSDRTSMPSSFIDLFGYGEDELERQGVASQTGLLELRSALVPLHASVVGASSAAFELHPTFIADLPEVLLGRNDFMGAFSVSIVEASREFSLFKR